MKLQDSDFTMENIRDFTDYFQELFENVDPSFLDGIAAIIRHAKEKLENVEIRETPPSPEERKLTENETIKMIEEFYSYLSPELGEIVFIVFSSVFISSSVSSSFINAGAPGLIGSNLLVSPKLSSTLPSSVAKGSTGISSFLPGISS